MAPQASPANDLPILALDAMGVLYEAADDVADLLIPFVHSKGSLACAEAIERAYLAASCGRLDPPAFWRQIGLDPAVEDGYLAGHRLVDGVREVLGAAGGLFGAVCCISNDVAAWSLKLRRSFGIEVLIDPWFISGDLGLRKPDIGIYREALDRLGALAPHRLLFVDDRVKNLDAAKSLGISTILFDPAGSAAGAGHVQITRLADLLDPSVVADATNRRR